MQTECSSLNIVPVKLAFVPPTSTVPKRQVTVATPAKAACRALMPYQDQWDELAWAALGLATTAGLVLSLVG